MLSRIATFCLHDAKNSSLGGGREGAHSRPCTQLAESQLLELLFQISPLRKPTNRGSSPGDAQEPAYNIFEKEPLPQPAMWFSLVGFSSFPGATQDCFVQVKPVLINS